MRSRSSRWIAGLGFLAVLGIAADSQAAPHAFRNPTLKIVIDLFNEIPLVVPPAASIPGVLNATRNGNTLTSAVFPAKVFDVAAYHIAVTDPLASPVTGAVLDVENPVGHFTAAGGAGQFGGAMPLQGTAKICLLLGCADPNGAATISLPVSVVGGLASATVTGLANLTVKGGVWRADTVTLVNGTGVTNQVTGGIAPTTKGEGYLAVKLVAPVLVTSTLQGPFAKVPTWGELRFEVPEPDVLALGLGAVAALVFMGLRRRHA